MVDNNKEIWVGKNRFYLGDNNTIYVTIEGEHDKKTAIMMRNAFYELLDMMDSKGNIFADNNKSGKPTLEARRIFKEMCEHEKVGKVAIFGLHPVARILATFVTGLSRNKDIVFFNSATDAYIIINFDWKIIEVNTKATSLYGYTYYELINMPIKGLIHSDYHHLIEQFKQNLQSIKQIQCELLGVQKDGNEINLEIKGNLFDFKEKIHILLILSDITERKKLEQKLKRYVSHLKKVSKLINRLT